MKYKTIYVVVTENPEELYICSFVRAFNSEEEAEAFCNAKQNTPEFQNYLLTYYQCQMAD